MTVDRAAKAINIKNSAPHSRPPAIWLNTLGSVMKIREGPEAGSMLIGKAGREDDQACHKCHHGI